jgi:hypothetical protein
MDGASERASKELGDAQWIELGGTRCSHVLRFSVRTNGKSGNSDKIIYYRPAPRPPPTPSFFPFFFFFFAWGDFLGIFFFGSRGRMGFYVLIWKFFAIFFQFFLQNWSNLY